MQCIHVGYQDKPTGAGIASGVQGALFMCFCSDTATRPVQDISGTGNGKVCE